MILGIAGRKRMGKDTIAKYLIDNHGFTKYSFADPLKHALVHMFGFNEDQLWGDLKEVIDPRWGISPRETLQILGTELLQFDIHKHTDKLKPIGRKIWTHRFKLWYQTLISQKNNDSFLNIKHSTVRVVIPDVRFKHEVEIIRELGGKIWVVERPELNNLDNHISENDLDDLSDFDCKIINDGDHNFLYNKIESCLKINKSTIS